VGGHWAGGVFSFISANLDNNDCVAFDGRGEVDGVLVKGLKTDMAAASRGEGADRFSAVQNEFSQKDDVCSLIDGRMGPSFGKDDPHPSSHCLLSVY